MSEVNWSEAPEDAEFYAGGRFRKASEHPGSALIWMGFIWEISIYTLERCKAFQDYEPRPHECTTTVKYEPLKLDDPVNNPKHYQIAPDVEAIDIIRAALTPEQFKGYLLGNFLKYRLRAGDKGDLQQDIDKSNWYKAELNK